MKSKVAQLFAVMPSVPNESYLPSSSSSILRLSDTSPAPSLSHSDSIYSSKNDVAWEREEWNMDTYITQQEREREIKRSIEEEIFIVLNWTKRMETMEWIKQNCNPNQSNWAVYMLVRNMFDYSTLCLIKYHPDFWHSSIPRSSELPTPNHPTNENQNLKLQKYELWFSSHVIVFHFFPLFWNHMTFKSDMRFNCLKLMFSVFFTTKN